MAPSQRVEFGNLGRRPPQRKESLTSGGELVDLFEFIKKDDEFMFTLVLYRSCQQLGGMCNLLGVFGPFGPRVGELYVSSCLH